jgi:hypothetical protein
VTVQVFLLDPCAPFSFPNPKCTPSLQTVSSCCQKLLSMSGLQYANAQLSDDHALACPSFATVTQAVCRKTLDDTCCVKAIMPVLNRIACFTSTLQDCYACTAVCHLLCPEKSNCMSCSIQQRCNMRHMVRTARPCSEQVWLMHT